ncbi:hypothetical protein CYMTET_56025 [Cymbomonas tetramitiformis]|uniref:Dynein regulatory complex protein 10 n=1 Tax=Cymbomonas tetramitiformis TaxID=36881 RepID=A0AAE0EMD8_9CHLO|nr:hypothetical protein CYMTET_56025 [Cymbomonas tetramitiformis]|eukprot:gene12506-14778_t
MNNVEAARVMNVLEDALANLRLISLVTQGALDSVEELEDVVGPELAGELMDHRTATSKVAIEGSEVLTSNTNSVCRTLRKNPHLESKLAQLFHDSRSQGMLNFIHTLEKVKTTTYKRLTTTVEEENSERDHFEEVCKREEKAGKERQSLEQQLRVERRERQKQLNHMTEMENRSITELEQIKATSVHVAKRLEEDAEATRESDKTTFQERDGKLVTEVTKLKGDLTNVQGKNRDDEGLLRKKKTKSEQEVGNWLTEYDKDMFSKEKALQEEKAVYEEVKQQLGEYEEEYRKLRDEAEAAAEKERKKAEEKARIEERQRKMDQAAVTIQKAWRTHSTTTGKGAEDTGKGKKGKKGKGKKKK